MKMRKVVNAYPPVNTYFEKKRAPAKPFFTAPVRASHAAAPRRGRARASAPKKAVAATRITVGPAGQSSE